MYKCAYVCVYIYIFMSVHTHIYIHPTCIHLKEQPGSVLLAPHDLAARREPDSRHLGRPETVSTKSSWGFNGGLSGSMRAQPLLLVLQDLNFRVLRTVGWLFGPLFALSTYLQMHLL